MLQGRVHSRSTACPRHHHRQSRWPERGSGGGCVFLQWASGLVIYRSLTLKKMFEILVEAFEASAIVLLIVAFAGLFSWAGTTVGILDTIAHLRMGISDNEWVVLLLINLLRFIGGMLIDAVSIFYIFLPILMPISSA